jgi:hypothetical protein
VDAKHQSFAKDLIIGQRLPPQILVRAADARPIELQDVVPADTRFKVLVFTGDSTDASQRTKVDKLAEAMCQPENFLKKYTPGEEWNKLYDVLAISSGKKEHVNYLEMPAILRSHWSKYDYFLCRVPLLIILEGFWSMTLISRACRAAMRIRISALGRPAQLSLFVLMVMSAM